MVIHQQFMNSTFKQTYYKVSVSSPILASPFCHHIAAGENQGSKNLGPKATLAVLQGLQEMLIWRAWRFSSESSTCFKRGRDMQCLPRSTHRWMDISRDGHNFQSWEGSSTDLWNVQSTVFKKCFNCKWRQKVLQFCVTQGHMGQRAIAKKSSFLSQHETPPQLSNRTGRSWSCVHKYLLNIKMKKYLMCDWVACNLLIFSTRIRP